MITRLECPEFWTFLIKNKTQKTGDRGAMPLRKIQHWGHFGKSHFFCWIAALTFIFFQVHADTQYQQLTTLNHQINILQDQMSSATKQSLHINQALVATEKQIHQSLRRLDTLKNAKAEYTRQLKTLKTRSDLLQQQLTAQQTQLTKQLALRYTLIHEEPFVLRLLQDNPDKTNRMLSLYDYLLQAHHQTVIALQATKTTLDTHERKINNALKAQKNLENHIQTEQTTLHENKRYHESILNKLDQKIKTQAEKLKEFKQNRQGLARLVSTLIPPSPQTRRTPFNLAAHHLHYPIAVPQNRIEKKLHGVLFKAEEGTTVRAIGQGRVVFSDWLKGYGLLIIIDHGHGLMSLYAHNQTLLKDKNQPVANGDPISSVGHTGGIHENGLYFELRQHGKVVSPTKWLS